MNTARLLMGWGCGACGFNTDLHPKYFQVRWRILKHDLFTRCGLEMLLGVGRWSGL
jgi:hypothetical protein